jgi:hypothetical protein
VDTVGLTVGSTIETPWLGPITVTLLLAATVPLARAALLATAQLEATMIYGQLSVALAGASRRSISAPFSTSSHMTAGYATSPRWARL